MLHTFTAFLTKQILILDGDNPLFHLLRIVFDLISNLDNFVRSTVQLVGDDLLKVLETTEECGLRTFSTL